ncbi:MAG: YkvA family protein [Gammaproteobacteria bacterium]|nr:YkvA family protein [Gammaproteobacteria bacterium]MDH4314538.1 YkvA family protein [Gammaproteobacteria bacterium]MDH5213981.1 YkvA family protein [Gammaproteobacteria bacterium]
MRVSFELHEDDLRHFRLIMQEARKSAARLSPEDIVGGARDLLAQAASGKNKVPHFIQERFESLELMIEMLVDHEWRLPDKDASRVMNALAYFCEPEDLIPDHIPGLGFLDDAIMIELVVRELQHEIDAYKDFREFRAANKPNRGVKSKTSDLTRDNWLESRRQALQSRMRRRRKRGSGGPDSPFRLL